MWLWYARIIVKRRFSAFRGPCALLFARAVYFAIVAKHALKTVIWGARRVCHLCRRTRRHMYLSFGCMAYLSVCCKIYAKSLHAPRRLAFIIRFCAVLFFVFVFGISFFVRCLCAFVFGISIFCPLCVFVFFSFCFALLCFASFLPCFLSCLVFYCWFYAIYII